MSISCSSRVYRLVLLFIGTALTWQQPVRPLISKCSVVVPVVFMGLESGVSSYLSVRGVGEIATGTKHAISC